MASERIAAFVVARSGGQTVIWSDYPPEEQAQHMAFATDREDDLICALRPQLDMCHDDWDEIVSRAAPPEPGGVV